MALTIEDLAQRRATAQLGGGEKRIETQHAKGRLTARERLDVLLDQGSFESEPGRTTFRVMLPLQILQAVP